MPRLVLLRRTGSSALGVWSLERFWGLRGSKALAASVFVASALGFQLRLGLGSVAKLVFLACLSNPTLHLALNLKTIYKP